MKPPFLLSRRGLAALLAALVLPLSPSSAATLSASEGIDLGHAPSGLIDNGKAVSLDAVHSSNPPTINLSADNGMISAAASIYGSGVIATGHEFRAYSDARIKTPRDMVAPADSLQKARALTLRHYQYKDVANKGKDLKTGVFAQDVEKVFPEAVSTTVDFIPEVYALAPVRHGNRVLVKTSFERGDTVKCYGADGHSFRVTVASRDAEGFTVNQTLPGKEVFVYGRQVHDFRYLDYDRLTILSLSAIQGLAEENDGLQTDSAALSAQFKAQEAKLHEQAAQLTTLKTAFESLQQRLADLTSPAGGLPDRRATAGRPASRLPSPRADVLATRLQP